MGVIAFSLLCCGTPPPGARRWNVVTEIQTRSFFCPDYARVNQALRRPLSALIGRSCALLPPRLPLSDGLSLVRVLSLMAYNPTRMNPEAEALNPEP